jgi:hypothetical protein
MRLHDLTANELAALQRAYGDSHGEVAAIARSGDAWATLEVLARKNLLRYHRSARAAGGLQAHVYRITKEGRLEHLAELGATDAR